MNRCRLGKTFLVLAILMCLAWVVPAAALDTNIRIVRLSYATGDLQLDRRQGQGYERALMNMPIVQGSRLWTRGEDALAEVEFEDGSTLRLTPDTAVEFQELSLRGSGEKVSSVNLESGTAYFDIRNHMGDFRVACGGEQITVAHPARFRVFVDNGQFKVAVYKGDLDVRSGENRIEVRNGETFTLELSDPRNYNLAKGIEEGSYDDWNQQRERYTQSYTAASTYSADSYYNGFSPSYSYGLADLAYYGNYSYAPGWGWVWRPYYTGAAWNPFMDGAWAWYPQFGYMWVSSYPWGWMPYRYGSWNFIPGYGWAWMPGTTWNTWVPVTAVNRPPLNWVPVRPPGAPPQPGTPGLVAVGRPSWSAHPPVASRPVIPGTGLLPLGGKQAPASHRVWGPSGVITNNGVVTSGAVAPATSASPASATVPATTVAPAVKPPTPSSRVHRDSSVRLMPGNKPSAPSPPARAQGSPSSGSSHSWGGEHAGAAAGGGHSNGSSASHSGARR